MPAMIGHSSHISQINRRKCDKNYSLFRIASLHVACGRDQFYIRVSIVPIFGNGATLGKRSNWYFLELCCAKLGSLTWWCLVVARRLLALQLLLMFFLALQQLWVAPVVRRLSCSGAGEQQSDKSWSGNKTGVSINFKTRNRDPWNKRNKRSRGNKSKTGSEKRYKKQRKRKKTTFRPEVNSEQQEKPRTE